MSKQNKPSLPRIQQFSVVLSLIFGVLLAPSSASADIMRGCAGEIYVSSNDIGVVSIMDLDASGSCSGVSTANNCRVQARLALFRCFDALWAERNTHAIPAECRADYSNRHRVNWTEFPGIYANLPGGQNSWIDRVRREACCNPTRHDEVTVFIGWNIEGDRGCGGNLTDPYGGVFSGSINSTYPLNCSNQVRRGICGSVPQRTNPKPKRTNPKP